MPKLYTTNSVLTFTNDTGTDTLQGAVNTAVSTRKPLHIAAGTYTFTGLTITGPVKIYGTKGSTILKPPAGATVAARIAIGSSPAGSRITDVMLEGLTIQGLDLPITGNAFGTPLGLVHAVKVDRLVVSDCYVGQSQGSGIQANECAGLIDNNEFWNCRTGVGLSLCVGMVVERNYIRDSKDNGINVSRVSPPNYTAASFDGAIIRANRIFTVDNATGGSGEFGNAIICTLAQGVSVMDNITSNTRYSGIRLNACAHSIVANNQILSARETGLFVECLGPDATGYTGITVTGNTLEKVGVGISVVNSDNGARRVTVTGNSVSNLRADTFVQWSSPDRNPANAYTTTNFAIGIMVAGTDIVVQGNTVEGKPAADSTPRMGVYLYSTGDWNPATNSVRSQTSAASILANNIIKSCPTGIGYVDQDQRGYAEVSGNIIIGANTGTNIIRVQQDTQPLGGQSDIGMTSTPIGDRYSFDRNKVVPLNS